MGNNSGMAIASMVLGILSLILSWIPLIGLIFPILGLTFGIIALRKISKDNSIGGKGMAITGIVLSSIVLLLYILIIIGVSLLLFGNPSNLVGDNDQMHPLDPANLAGDSFQISAPLAANGVDASNTQIRIEIRNGASETITITSTTINGCGTNSDSLDIISGSLQTISVGCNPILVSGNRFSGDVIINYKLSGESITQTATGQILLRV